MSSLDDELALFEAEMNSLVEDSPGTSEEANNLQTAVSASSSSLTGADLQPPFGAPLVGAPSILPMVDPALFVPRVVPFGNAVVISNGPPLSSFAAAAVLTNGGILLPPQLRHHPPAAPPMAAPATIESKPHIYQAQKGVKEEEVKKEVELKTMALPADVELAELKKAKERNMKNSYLGQVQRGEKKMKRFLRCAGGETWEDNSLAEWDPNDFRIFCGDLGNEVSDELLAKAFRKYPTFQKAKVVRDSKSNKSKGFGFVSFKSQEDFIRAMREMDGKYVGNRPIKLRKSNWKDRSAEVVRKKMNQKKKLGLI